MTVNGFLNRRPRVRITLGTPPNPLRNIEKVVAHEAHETRTSSRATVRDATNDDTPDSRPVRSAGKPRLRYVEITRTRHGRTVYYFRRSKGVRIRLPDAYGSSDFMKEYAAALSGEVPAPKQRRAQRPKGVNRFKAQKAMEAALARGRERSKDRGREFSLTLEWALDAIEQQGFCCSLTGIPFYTDVEDSKFRHPFAPSIDRIDSNIGYVPSNCRIIVTAANIALSDWGEDVLRKVALGYARVHRFQLSEPHRVAKASRLSLEGGR